MIATTPLVERFYEIALLPQSARPMLHHCATANSLLADLRDRGTPRPLVYPRRDSIVAILDTPGALVSLTIRPSFARVDATAIDRATRQRSTYSFTIGERLADAADTLIGWLQRTVADLDHRDTIEGERIECPACRGEHVRDVGVETVRHCPCGFCLHDEAPGGDPMRCPTCAGDGASR